MTPEIGVHSRKEPVDVRVRYAAINVQKSAYANEWGGKIDVPLLLRKRKRDKRYQKGKKTSKRSSKKE